MLKSSQLYYIITSNSNNNELFFLPRISESINRTLNNREIGLYKSYFIFSNEILELIKLPDNKNIYEERNLSIIRSLDYYIKKNKGIKVINLIINEDLITIKEEYLKFRIKNNLTLDEETCDQDIILLNSGLKEKSYNSDDELSDNIYTVSDFLMKY